MKLPPNARPLYRIMNKDSKLEGGQFVNQTIGKLLDLGEFKYLGWLYFCNSALSFSKDVLAELGITPIQKPGTDEKAMWAWYKEYQKTHFSDEQMTIGRMRRAQVRNRIAKARLCDARRATTFTKGQLEAANHGHIKLDH